MKKFGARNQGWFFDFFIDVYQSKTDRFGNSYTAVKVRNMDTGEPVELNYRCLPQLSVGIRQIVCEAFLGDYLGEDAPRDQYGNLDLTPAQYTALTQGRVQVHEVTYTQLTNLFWVESNRANLKRKQEEFLADFNTKTGASFTTAELYFKRTKRGVRITAQEQSKAAVERVIKAAPDYYLQH